ncbi:hypothetical protein GCM10010191_01240 [Actinomadura vinacea]|uniref:Uncharacterized protein n=1 Tax=Actinomadura vinacea TaxID=115336 RepID=A0ABP5VAS0_9ACTN
MASMARPNPLARLGAHLGAHGFAVDLTDRGLTVSNPEVAGCCPEVARTSDTITCRSRREDGGRLWFWSSWGQPLAEADHITDALIAVKINLAGRDTAEGGR